MPPDTKRPIWLGALVAPSVAPVLYYFGVVLLASPPIDGPSDVLAGLYVVGLSGLPFSYMASLSLGVPAVLLLRAFGLLYLEWTLIVGAAAGALALLGFLALLWGLDFVVSAGVMKIAQYSVTGASLGLGVGSVFCKICGITRRSSRRSQARAA